MRAIDRPSGGGRDQHHAYIDIPRVVRDTIRGIGYDRESYGFDGNTCGVITSIDEQSPDIAIGVDKAAEQRAGTGDKWDEIGAGDQGMMFGYACDDTDDLMPMPIWLAHRLAYRLAEVRKSGQLPYLRPDGKTQVSIEYEDGRPKRLRPCSSPRSTRPASIATPSSAPTSSST
jgi:S-adenosylmethionine synthetase